MSNHPVAWMHVQGNFEEPSHRQLHEFEIMRGWTQYPLYTHPTPPRTEPEQKPAIYPEEAFEMGLEAVAYYTYPVNDTALLRRVVELLEPIAHNTADDPRGKAFEAITALRTALAESPDSTKPVAESEQCGNNSCAPGYCYCAKD